MVLILRRLCAKGKKTQSGAALLVSLVMLLLMTLIGVATMNTTILESKMAGNAQAEIQLFNNVESALRAAEQDVQEEILDEPELFNFFSNNGYYDSPVNLSTLSWNDSDSVDNVECAEDDDDCVEPDYNDRYIVRYIGPHTFEGESAAWNVSGGISGSSIYIFEITSRSVNPVKGTTQMLRSTYATFDGP